MVSRMSTTYVELFTGASCACAVSASSSVNSGLVYLSAKSHTCHSCLALESSRSGMSDRGKYSNGASGGDCCGCGCGGVGGVGGACTSP